MRIRCLSFSSVASVLSVAFALGLSGCSTNFGDVSNTATQTAMHIRGVVHGGQQPISGSHVYMYAASTVAYGGQGIAPTSGTTGNASTSLLTAATGNSADTNGNFYVTTDAFGNFDISGAFACTSGQQVYLYSTGGDPQLAGFGVAGTPNPAASLLAVVGGCASATPGAAFPGVSSVFMNEVSTVAAAYALAGFASDPLHIGAPSAVTGHSLAGVGLANAFNTALNIANQASGTPNATLPLNSNAVVPVTTINTLADVLAACINSNGISSSGCSTLFANATNGTAPTDTAAAAINIAQHPAANVSALLNLATNASPFQPIVTAANDLTLSINYTSSLPDPEGIAIDGTGNVWVINGRTKSVTEISSAGAVLSGTSGYTGGGLNNPEGIAIDTSGNAWVANQRGVAVTEISGSGSFLSGATGYTDPSGGLGQPDTIAIDGLGNAWATNSDQGFVTELSRTGTILNSYTIDNGLFNAQGIAIDGSGNLWLSNGFANAVTKASSTGANLSGAGFTGGGLGDPDGIAIDSAGNAWVANIGTSVTKLSNSGAVLSGPNGFTGGGLNDTLQLAIDGSGNVWVANLAGNSVTELSNSGAFLSGANGYTSTGLNEPFTIAVDGSGDVWVTNKTSMTEIVGVGTPVITPIAAGLPVIPTANGSSNLGTRP
ncbi:NHL repeat-containing protein [Granulicella mallensis]|uniref:NHL repeat containing protein n=1 Tax=Granulicella mallensis (strain ATCC BAA-1857 / DSM 23137 / MP5ACTX8) TaxID=682795 RepID=G8NNV2_GRAMM|nr:NHL repeat-containing protein [Granulicella mallensis]AEU35977.1 NHL repeat containing protein [Granulicella mallensis MP5ACTX8]